MDQTDGGKSTRVLLIGGNSGFASEIRQLLITASEGSFDLVCADQLPTGFKCLDEQDIHAVLLDICLLDGKGSEAIAQIHRRSPSVPIIALIGTFNEKLAGNVMLAGASEYLLKEEIDSKILSCIIRHAIRRVRMEQALRESTGRLQQALGELKSAQQQLVQQERLSALGQMASGISHDFNNALSAIIGFTEMLITCPEKMQNKEKAIRCLYMINTAAQDAASLVRRVREFARERSQTETFQPVDLNQIVERAILLTRPKWKAQALGSNRTIDMKTDLQQIPAAKGNESELREILVNLIFNAVDALPADGTITLRTRPDGDYVILEVSDTGAGMSDDIVQQCFEPFFTTKGEDGSGLGLAMVHGILRRHKGKIDVQSKPNEGTTFSIRLPVWADQAAKEDKYPTGRIDQEARFGTRRLHALVVEDDPLVRETLVEYLTQDGHTVDTAANGPDGLTKFYAGWFDVVMTSKAIPEMSGAHLTAVIKRKVPNKPVILMTGFGNVIEAQARCPEDADVVISKPITQAKLREALEKAMLEQSHSGYS